MKWVTINKKYKIGENGEICCYSGIKKTSYKPFTVKQRLQEGYLIYLLNYDNKKQVKCLVHRLVYTHFIGEIPENCDIHHKDENRLNNHYSNLEAIDHSLHTKMHWIELKKEHPKIKKERKIKDITKNKTYDMKEYQKAYRKKNREMRLVLKD